MWLFFTILLVFSCIGMLAILSLKRYELRTGRVFFAGSRPRMGDFFSRGLVWLERGLPTLVAHGMRRGWATLNAWAHRAVAWTVIVAESLLEQGLQVLRHKTDAKPAGEASPFLREVAEHKKNILRGAQEDEQPEI